ncbi:MAG: redox-sensing transcriptional repressor Rex [bacterium]|jgi:redox-sensing transcriptional repressor
MSSKETTPVKRKRNVDLDQIPYSTITRLTQYLRVVEKLDELGVSNISSAELSEETKINSFLVRKDLSYFGEFGTRGVGYEIPILRREIRHILGLNRKHKTIVVGAGNLGRALVHYRGFLDKGFEICAVFDSDPDKIGRQLEEFYIQSVFNLEEYLQSHQEIAIGIIAVPLTSAQFIANLLVANGIQGILNFAPVALEIPPDVVYVPVDLTTHLEVISFYITHPGAYRPSKLE